MAKPSIFSKDYEKKMKKRRLKILISIIVVIFIALGLFYEFKLKGMDFNQIVNNLQAWANNDSVSNEHQPVKNNQTQKEEAKNTVEEQKPSAPVDSDLEFKLLDNEVVKFKVQEQDGNKIFLNIETKGFYSNISPNKKEAVVEDGNQNMFLVNINGEVKNITKAEYVSRRGDKYPKDAMIQKEKDSGVNYLWGVNPTFIDNDTIVYISNLPYFGASAKNKYLWIYDIKNSTYKAIWNSASNDLEILGANEGKNNINVKVGNVEYILDNQGKLFKE